MRKYFKLAPGGKFGLVEENTRAEILSRENANRLLDELGKSPKFSDMVMDKERLKKGHPRLRAAA